jgi:hypothetical protein
MFIDNYFDINETNKLENSLNILINKKIIYIDKHVCELEELPLFIKWIECIYKNNSNIISLCMMRQYQLEGFL